MYHLAFMFLKLQCVFNEVILWFSAKVLFFYGEYLEFLIVTFYPLQEIAFPKMVASCCRFLCYFCRISRQNQKAMFDHLSYLLENSSVGLGEWSIRRNVLTFPTFLQSNNKGVKYKHYKSIKKKNWV